jgi:heme/copper-type cytochrome/quinol oxidase subunit 3
MSTATLATIEDLGEVVAPPPARPRVLLVATVLASAASVATFAGLLGVYLHERAAALAAGEWKLHIPLTPGTMSLVGFGISMVTIQWAVQAIGADDRRHAWMAFGATIVIAGMHAVGMGFLYTQVRADVHTPTGGLFYAVTGAHLAMVLCAVVFILLMAFRTLGGQYSAKDREGVVAAAIFWHTTAIVYAGVWLAILVTK